MKVGLSLLYLAGSSLKQMYADLERMADECSVWELVDDGNLKLDDDALRRLKEYASTYGFEYSLHAPFTDLNIASLNPEVRRLSLKAVEKAIQKAWKLNAGIVVIHPGFKGALEYFFPGKSLQVNLKAIRKLLSLAEELGVRLALENMPKGSWAILSTVEDFEGFFVEEGLEGLGLALDVGHALTIGQVEAFLKKFKGKISHVHLHDNLGEEDSHLRIGAGKVDWNSTLKALKEAGFNGYLIVESVQQPYQSLKTLKELLQKV